ncbi:hypothetical protein KC336_g5760 [Hortaea werneckii]|nr:hypothetical protein KC336_g5760 [Hortaea werneckii]
MASSDYTTPVKLIPTRGIDTRARFVERQLLATSQVLTAKFERWTDKDKAEGEFLEAKVEGDGPTLTVYISIRNGVMPQGLAVSQLFKAYMLADFLIDDVTKDQLMNEIMDKCVQKKKLHGINLETVMVTLSSTDTLSKFCVDFAVRQGAKEGKMPDDLPETLQARLGGRMFELVNANAHRQTWMYPSQSILLIVNPFSGLHGADHHVNVLNPVYEDSTGRSPHVMATLLNLDESIKRRIIELAVHEEGPIALGRYGHRGCAHVSAQKVPPLALCHSSFHRLVLDIYYEVNVFALHISALSAGLFTDTLAEFSKDLRRVYDQPGVRPRHLHIHLLHDLQSISLRPSPLPIVRMAANNCCLAIATLAEAGILDGEVMVRCEGYKVTGTSVVKRKVVWRYERTMVFASFAVNWIKKSEMARPGEEVASDEGGQWVRV